MPYGVKEKLLGFAKKMQCYVLIVETGDSPDWTANSTCSLQMSAGLVEEERCTCALWLAGGMS